jgi:uncharacterized protein YgiM (DUF1202 family)
LFVTFAQERIDGMKALIKPWILVLVFTLIISLVLSGGKSEAATLQNAVVNAKSIIVRTGPGSTYTSLGFLKSGAKIGVYSKTNTGWSEIRYNKRKAFVSTHYLKFPNALSLSANKYKGISKLKYPQVKGLKNKAAENKINSMLSNHIKKSYKGYLEVLELEKSDKALNKKDPEFPFFGPYEYIVNYTIQYNQDGLLSIKFSDYSYAGGAHGMGAIQTYNFSINTGQEIKLLNIFNTKEKQAQVQQYAYNYMVKHHDQFLFVNKFDDFKLDNNTAFYYTSSGIALVFQEYEVSSYAEGNPTLFIPKSLYSK